MATSPPPYTKMPEENMAGYATGYDQAPRPQYAPPPAAGYPPPPQQYAPPPQQYAPPPQMMYPPPVETQQSTPNNVIVVGGGAPVQNTVIVREKGVNHCLHCCISIFFFPWIIVWICLCICG